MDILAVLWKSGENVRKVMENANLERKSWGSQGKMFQGKSGNLLPDTTSRTAWTSQTHPVHKQLVKLQLLCDNELMNCTLMDNTALDHKTPLTT